MNLIKKLINIDFINQEYKQDNANKCFDIVSNDLHLFFNSSKEKEMDLSKYLNDFEEIKISILSQNFKNMVDFLEFSERKIISYINTPKDIVLSLISGRLAVLKMYYQISFQRKLQPTDEKNIDYLISNIQNFNYSIGIKDLEQIQEIITKAKVGCFEKDFLYDYSAIKHWRRSYLNTNKDAVVTEYLHEIFILSSMSLSSVEKKENIVNMALIFYELLSNKKISLSSPMLINFRKNQKKNLSSCFILKTETNSASFGYLLLSTILISRQNGGVGLYLGHLNDVIVASKIFNSLSVAFAQDENSKRQSAFTIAVEIWHIDILKFLDIQSEVGDQRFGRCYDIFPQLVVVDEFMKRLLNKQDWYLFSPGEVKNVTGIELDKLYGEEFSIVYNNLINDVLEKKIDLKYRKINSLDLMITVIQRLLETGLPYIFFKCTVNNVNPNKHKGMICCGNLCQESYSNVENINIIQNENMDLVEERGAAHTCNLCSLNLSNLLTLEEIKYATKYATRMLDNAIDITQTPIKASLTHNKKYRTIGIGVMGLHDYLTYYDLAYEESGEIVEEIFKNIAYSALESSIELSKERGSFEAFEGSELQNGIYCGLKMDQLGKDWLELSENIKKYGIRNSQLLAVAPTSSTSLMMNATASILPVFKSFMIDSNNKGYNVVLPRFSYFKDYIAYKNMDINNVIKVVSKMQKFIDQGISYELLFDINHKSLTAGKILETIINAWMSKIKALYYTRTIQKKNMYVKDNKKEINCESCAL